MKSDIVFYSHKPKIFCLIMLVASICLLLLISVFKINEYFTFLPLKIKEYLISFPTALVLLFGIFFLMYHEKIIISLENGVVKYYGIYAINNSSKDIALADIKSISISKFVNDIDYEIKKPSQFIVFHRINSKDFIKISLFTKKQINKIISIVQKAIS